MKPLCVELYAGKFGWGRGFDEAGYRVIGFDILHESYHGKVPEGCSLVLQDVRTLHGSQFKDAAIFVCSPPCQAYSWMSMPWSLAKNKALGIRGRGQQKQKQFDDILAEVQTVQASQIKWAELNELFHQCWRIRDEASQAAGRYIPLVIENVRGAQPWVGRSKAAFGSFHLWGDIAQVGKRIMRADATFGETRYLSQPSRSPMKNAHRSNGETNFHGHEGTKAPGMNWSDQSKRGQDFTRCAEAGGYENAGHKSSGNSPQMWKDREGGHFDGSYGLKLPGNNSARRWEDREVQRLGDATKGGGGGWFNETYAEQKANGKVMHGRGTSSKSNTRKAASAQIAMIPPALARHIAEIFKP